MQIRTRVAAGALAALAAAGCAAAGLRGHLIQCPQQPQPAGEPDVLPRAGPRNLPGTRDDPKTAGRRLGPVQDNTDLHTPIVPAPAAATIS